MKYTYSTYCIRNSLTVKTIGHQVIYATQMGSAMFGILVSVWSMELWVPVMARDSLNSAIPRNYT